MTDDYVIAERAAPAGAPLLVLLHGTGGDEQSFVDLGRQLLPGAYLVAPRGDVSEGGALRFFRRTGEGVYDMADFARATAKLTAFLETLRRRHPDRELFALGYSNGANILASVLFAAPQTVDRAVLMHPLIPFAPQAQPGLAGKKVLLTAGRRDPISPAPLTEQLAQYFVDNGATTELIWHAGGHEARPEEFAAATALFEADGAA